MKRSYRYSFIIILTILNLQVIHPQWVQTTLDTGNVTSLAVNGNNLYAGTNAIGAFLSTNNGSTWTAISNGLTNTHIVEFAIDELGFLYAATPPGVFITTNQGTNWSFLSPIQSTQVFSLIVKGDFIFAGTYFDGYGTAGGIYRSSDFGVSWSRVFIGGFKLDYVGALATKNNVIIAGLYNKVVVSMDDGNTWNSYGIGYYTQYVTSVSINDTNYYATFSDGYGISCSTNGGSVWHAINNGLSNLYVNKLAFFGNNIFAATGAGVFQSTNNGANWFDVSNGLNNQKVGSLIIKGDTLFAGTQHGVWYRTLSEILDVKTEKPALPTQFNLKQNYPNPFNPSTTISYSLAKEGLVKLSVFNALGSNVATILNEYKPAGEYSVQFNASNLPSGIYLYRIHSGSFVDTKKMILVK